MKIRSLVSTIILVFVLFITIGFSSFCSEMSISKIVAEVRVKKDVRITSFDIKGAQVTSDVGTVGFTFDADSILLDYCFGGLTDYIEMDVNITNIGSAEVGIFNISVPEGVSYETTNYNLKEKLCDSTGSCSLGINKVINLKVYPTSEEVLNLERINVDFDFKEFYSVNYEYVIGSGNYPTEVLGGDSLNITFNKAPGELSIYSNSSLVDSSAYTYSDGVLNYPSVNGNVLIKAPKTLNYVMQLGATSDSGISFSSSTGLDTLNNTAYVRNGTESDTNPIYYYRGNVSTNNVIFGNVCWEMVRTTDTGGVKLVYNGVPSEEGTCDNTDTASQLTNVKAFNGDTSSPAHAGYMYGTVYPYYSKAASDLSSDVIYSNNVTYESGIYTLTGEQTTSSSWDSDRTTLAKKYHYTCFTSGTTCEEVAYVTYFGNSSTIYYLILNGVIDIEEAKTAMFSNVENSALKTEIDTWYAENMNYYTSLIEDTVYCNDRTLYSGSLKGKDVDAGTGYSMFGTVGRIYNAYNPSLTCPSVTDSFTTDPANGNGKLTYPVGLLTADEMTMIGHSRSTGTTLTFLHTGQRLWTMSPYCFSYHSVYHFMILTGLGFTHSGTGLGIRPVISLKENNVVVSGDGTVANPFVMRSIFDIKGVYYYYEPGMTWNDWINSKYNTSGVSYNGGMICENGGMVDTSIDDKIESISYTKSIKCSPVPV